MRKLPIEYVQNKNRHNYFLFKNDGGLSGFIREDRMFEEHLYNLYKKINCNGKNIIDIGANLGVHTLEFAEMVGDNGKVYSFNIALSDKNGMTHIEKQDFHKNDLLNIGNTHISENGNEVEERTLDSYNFKDIKIIKIDVQGYEPFILNGSIKTIEENNPYIFIEIEDEHLTMFNKNPDDIKTFLNENGFLLKWIELFDYIAIPKFEIRFEDKIYLKSNSNVLATKIIFREYNSKLILYRQFNINFNDNVEWWFNSNRLLDCDKLILEIYNGDNIIFKRNINK